MSSSPHRKSILLDTELNYSYLEWNADPSFQSTIILIHGFLDIAWSWHWLVDQTIGRDFHIIAPDMRGHGNSDRVGPGGHYHFPDYIADLDSLIQRTARERLFLVGHSMGGVIASYYTGTFPDKVHRLALLEGTGPPENTDTMPDRVHAWIAMSQRMRTKKNPCYQSIQHAATRLQKHDPLLTTEIAESLAHHGTRAMPDGRVQFKHDPRHLAPNPYPFHVSTAEQFWRRINCPILLLSGSDSRFRTAVPDADTRLRGFPNVEYDIIPGAGHRMHCHKPQETGARLRGFLRDATP